MSEVRVGYVSSIDYENGLCEIHYPDRDDTVTEMVPFLSNREYRTPEVEDMVLVLHPGDSPEDAVVVGTIWNEKIKPAEGKKGIYRKEFSNKDGQAYRKFDANAKELTDHVDGKRILEAKSLEIKVGGATVTISESGAVPGGNHHQGCRNAGTVRQHDHGQCRNGEHHRRRWRRGSVWQVFGEPHAHRQPGQSDQPTDVRRCGNVCWHFRRCDFLRGAPADADPL